MTNWKPGDEFIITGPDEELDLYALLEYKGSIRTVVDVNKHDLSFNNPVTQSVDTRYRWRCEIRHARKVTKLDKALK